MMFTIFSRLLSGALYFMGTLAPLPPINHLLYTLQDPSTTSLSTGEIASGSLTLGRRLPTRGRNFSSYSELGSLLGRTHVHSVVHDTLLDAYERLSHTHPDQHFVYAETGWPMGGSFAPHRTHQNGLSVDFVVPVSREQRPASLYCGIWNAWCYAITFDEQGRSNEHEIDFEALGAHLLALDAAARQHGTRVERVILAPDLRAKLFQSTQGERIKKQFDFLQGKAWVRHDDHYHVDFAAP